MSAPDSIERDIDVMRDVYMSREQRAAYERILAALAAPSGAAAWQTRYPDEHWMECNQQWHDIVKAERPNDARALFTRPQPAAGADLAAMAANWREQAEQQREAYPGDPFAGHDYDDCANQLEQLLRGE